MVLLNPHGWWASILSREQKHKPCKISASKNITAGTRQFALARVPVKNLYQELSGIVVVHTYMVATSHALLAKTFLMCAASLKNAVLGIQANVTDALY